MLNTNNSTQEAIHIDRLSMSHDWISAQVRGNLHAGFGVACMMLPVVLIVSIVLDMSWSAICLGAFMCVGIGMARFGWLQHNRFSLDEWVESGNKRWLENRVNELEGYESEVKALRQTNSNLKERLLVSERLAGTTPPKVRTAQPEPVQQPVLPTRPRNAEAALRIHQAWMLDATGGEQINRTFLMQNCRLTRSEVEEGWDLLQSLGFADRDSNHTSAKWVVTNTDSHDLSVEIDRHITSATANVVHNR